MSGRRFYWTTLPYAAATALGIAVSSTTAGSQTAPQLAAMMTSARPVSARVRGFEERMQLGRGQFFDQRTIEQRNVVAVVDLLRQARAVKLDFSGGGVHALSARQTTRCPMQVYLDGVPLAGAGSRADALFDLNQLPSPKDVMGIEVYAGDATTPLWLPLGPSPARIGCGAVLVWTRDGSTG